MPGKVWSCCPMPSHSSCVQAEGHSSECGTRRCTFSAADTWWTSSGVLPANRTTGQVMVLSCASVHTTAGSQDDRWACAVLLVVQVHTMYVDVWHVMLLRAVIGVLVVYRLPTVPSSATPRKRESSRDACSRLA